jgi:MEMO1 family protein
MHFMFKRFVIFCSGVLCLLSLSLAFKPNPESSKPYYLKYQYSIFSDKPDYYLSSIRKVFHTKRREPGVSIDPTLPVRWGIVSHHLLIKDSIAEFFFHLSKAASPKTIMLIGPDHFSRSQFTITVSTLLWKTPFGLIKPDYGIIHELITSHIAHNDENAFYNEHSIGALVPFIKYYFPHANIVTIIIRSDATMSEGQSLAEFISSLKEPHVLSIASLDFSHYKTSAVAQREDSVTYKILSSFDNNRYLEAYVDSHIAFYTILESCNKLHAHHLKIIHHTNSGLFTGETGIPCTSYFNLLIW